MLVCSSLSFTAVAEIDGVLNEPMWQQASTFNLDKTVSPFTLAQADKPTEVKYYASEEGIHVAVISAQPSTEQTAVRTARDTNLESDYIELILDFDNSRNTGYAFLLGNGGSMRDGVWQNNNQFKSDWDGKWFGRTTQTDNAWIAEYLIPWTVAPMAKVSAEQREFGIYVLRHDVKSNISYSHQGTSSSQPDFIREFAQISVANHAGSSLDIFGTATLQNDLLHDNNETNLGVDIFWRPDASKQLSVAFNPDFGHVESDNLVVNFSPYETFFAERRPFFTENQALFDIQGNAGMRLVHTRRIGVHGDIDSAIKYTANGQSSDYGVMAVFEDEGHVSPESNKFAAARYQHRFDDSQVGYLLTYADTATRAREAMIHSVDLRTDLSDSIQIQAQVNGSFVENKGKKLEGYGGWFNVIHKFDANWQQQLNLTQYDDKFEVNDLGFLSRSDLQRIWYNNERYFTGFDDTNSLNQRRVEVFAMLDRNSNGDHLSTEIGFTGTEEYKDSSSLFWRVDYAAPGVDDRTTRGNGVFNIGSSRSFFTEYNFGNQNQFRHHVAFGLDNSDADGDVTRFHYHPSYYFNDNYRVSWSLWYTQEAGSLFWIDDQLARYDFKEFENSLDFDATIDDKQELRVRFQWVSVTGKNGSVFGIDESKNLYSKSGIANDFSNSVTRLQVRYRYEIAPLSNIFLVYSRGGEYFDENDQNALSLFKEGWDNRTGDNFVAKIRYRF
ncbi:hypothetical protein PALB_33940 [Pseudoalteromonas luteoviolacea B = ATCC 29581]|nr:hypothetical protein PALB_33940 [Pseudoalteromonas luteoviolacea B = ATCC 29581]